MTIILVIFAFATCCKLSEDKEIFVLLGVLEHSSSTQYLPIAKIIWDSG
jgi:hypothetical protein